MLEVIANERSSDKLNYYVRKFEIELFEFLKDTLHDEVHVVHETRLHVPKHTVISASNPTLSAALFSASAIKNRLLGKSSSTYYAFAREGLQLLDADGKARTERGRGPRCLFAVVSRRCDDESSMMEQWLGMSDGQEAVVQALKGLKERGVVTTSGGMHLFD